MTTHFETMDRERVFLTGATGFIGYNIALELLASGYQVRILVRKSNPFPDNEAIECVYGDILNYDDIQTSLIGCDYVIHTAGLYTFDPKLKELIYKTNIEGTRNVCMAVAQNENIKRLVYTSSAATIGKNKNGLSDEDTKFNLWSISSSYKKSKVLAENIVHKFYTESNLPVIILNPSLPLGSYDIKPTPTGLMVKDFLQSDSVSFIDGGFNFVHVKDVAQIHVLALKLGRLGEKYIIGNANLDLIDFYQKLQQYKPKVKLIKVPYLVALFFSFIHSNIRRLAGKEPKVTPRGVQLSKKKMFYNNEKVKRDFSYRFIPIEIAIQESIDWFSSDYN